MKGGDHDNKSDEAADSRLYRGRMSLATKSMYLLGDVLVPRDELIQRGEEFV